MSATWQQSYQEVIALLAPEGPAEVHRFWVLFVGGKSGGEGAWFWIQSFKRFYILHLLVLSGSQVESLSRLVRALVSRASEGPGASFVLQSLLTLVLWGFAAATGWSAPITRATVLGLLSLWLLRLDFGVLLLLAFALQWGLFPEHRSEMGFYLSWIAYLVVVGAARLKIPRFAVGAVVSAVLFLVVDTMFFGNPFAWDRLAVCVLANAFFAVIFDKLMMPLAAVMILVGLLLAVGGRGWGPLVRSCGDFLALWTQPMGEALLVVLKWLMYT